MIGPHSFPFEMKQLVITNCNKLARFQFKYLVFNPGTIPKYANWWKSISGRAFTSLPEHYLSKLFNSNHGKSSQPSQATINKATPQTNNMLIPRSTFLNIRGKHLNFAYSWSLIISSTIFNILFIGCKISNCGYGDQYSNSVEVEDLCKKEPKNSYFDYSSQGCRPNWDFCTRDFSHKSKCLFSIPTKPIFNFSSNLYFCFAEGKKK